jgi:hypothetical protein
MRKLVAVAVGLGFLAVAACGANSSTLEDNCAELGGLCVKAGSECGDTLPYQCASGGVCCSPNSQAAPASVKPSVEPAPR